VTAKVYAPPQDESVPFVDHRTQPEYDGFLFGIPTKFGNTASQFKDFWDKTGKLWTEGALSGKHYGVFVSVGTQGGGMEETVITSISNFVHHGMILVPVRMVAGDPASWNSTLQSTRGDTLLGLSTCLHARSCHDYCCFSSKLSLIASCIAGFLCSVTEAARQIILVTMVLVVPAEVLN